MKIPRIIILFLVFSMLFVNETSILAIEIQNDDAEILYTYRDNIIENDISTNSVGDVYANILPSKPNFTKIWKSTCNFNLLWYNTNVENK